MKHRILYTLALMFATMQTFAQTYTYDNLNRLTKVVYGNGVTVTYGYDALGNRTSKKVSGATTETFTITVAVTPEGSGTVTGGGSYTKGSTVELNAIANAGYEFSKWGDNVTTNPRTITVTQNMTYTAIFIESETPALEGDINNDGKVNLQDLNLLVDAYLSNASVTTVTDIDDDGSLTIADIAKLASIVESNIIHLDSNGHQYVDLNLPSGTLWATCNIGASAPEETGSLFAWGETNTKDVYSWETYKWCSGSVCNSSNQTLTKYGVTGAYGVVDDKTTLEAADDAATVLWKGDWRMPTNEEIQELIDNTTSQYTKLNSVKGYLLTGTNGNSIFIPLCEGSYWSSSLRTSGHSTNADCLEINSTDMEVSGSLRYRGIPVRPVLAERSSNP